MVRPPKGGARGPRPASLALPRGRSGPGRPQPLCFRGGERPASRCLSQRARGRRAEQRRQLVPSPQDERGPCASPASRTRLHVSDAPAFPGRPAVPAPPRSRGARAGQALGLSCVRFLTRSGGNSGAKWAAAKRWVTCSSVDTRPVSLPPARRSPLASLRRRRWSGPRHWPRPARCVGVPRAPDSPVHRAQAGARPAPRPGSSPRGPPPAWQLRRPDPALSVGVGSASRHPRLSGLRFSLVPPPSQPGAAPARARWLPQRVLGGCGMTRQEPLE